MSKVFISYRRENAAGYAQAIYGQLERDLRRDQIFMDVDTVEPGVDFVTRIEQAVSESEVVIALIGNRWMGERENAPPRIHDAQDFVHLEIAAALSRDIRVIPVLVDGANMPNKEQLPGTLQPLVRRNALELSNTRFRFDLERVSQAVQKALIPPSVPKRIKWRWRPWMGYCALSILLLTLGIAAGLWFKEGEDKQTATKRVEEPPPVKKAPLLEKKQPVKIEHPLNEDRAAKPSLVPGTVFRDRLKIGGEGPEMVVVPAGTFQMGDIQGSGMKNEQPVHPVRIRKPFAIGRYEITFDDYERFAKATGKRFPTDNDWGRGRRPVITVSWQDAKDYTEWLSEQTGKRYRLATEAEWEYAARAGTESAYWWGKDLSTGMANCDGCGSQWDRKHTAPVGSFKPNKFGLYDTAGNVWEWVEDCRHASYDGAPTDGSAWLEAGGGDCSQRVVRGGSWNNGPEYLRSSYRFRGDADFRNYDIGFRLAQDIS